MRRFGDWVVLDRVNASIAADHVRGADDARLEAVRVCSAAKATGVWIGTAARNNCESGLQVVGVASVGVTPGRVVS